MILSREHAKEFVGYVVDDTGCGRIVGDDMHAVVREDHKGGFEYGSVLVGWQCGFESMFVAVHSYLDVKLDSEECIEMATEYLDEIGWFSEDGSRHPEHVIH